MKEDLIAYATEVAAGVKANIDPPQLGTKAELEQIDRVRVEIDERLDGYRDAMAIASDVEPPCPECWMEKNARMVMKPGDTPPAKPVSAAVDVYVCGCGFRYPTFP